MEDIYDPVKEYSDKYKNAVTENSNASFDSLVSESKIDVDANRSTVKDYDNALAKQKKLSASLGKIKVIKVLLIIFTVLALAIGILLIISGAGSAAFNLAMLISGIALVLLGIGAIVLLCTVIKRKLHDTKAFVSTATDAVNKLFQEANEQMAGMNALFTYSGPDQVLMKSIPQIQVDPYFDMKKYGYMVSKMNLSPANDDPNVSTLFVKSGSLSDNPFLIIRSLITYMGSKTYTGTRTVTWVTTETDSEGHSHTVTHSETLVATISKPCPYYYTNESLIYGNPAAPKLSFSRAPVLEKHLDDKGLDHFVKNYEKKLKKESVKAVKKGQVFQSMSNTQFEAMFGVTERSDEVEYRLMFTPLGQQAMCNLINNSPYGDDWSLDKKNMLNIIHAEHSQTDDKLCEPSLFRSHSVDISRGKFVDYCENYVQSLYFELAPVLAIPLYQQTSPILYDYLPFPYHVSEYEHEVYCNYFPNDIDPEGSVTRSIRKTKFLFASGDYDVYTVTSRAYRGVSHTEIIPVLCRNGRVYEVPVTWVEYIPIVKTTTLTSNTLNGKSSNEVQGYLHGKTLYDFLSKLSNNGNLVYGRGFFSLVLANANGNPALEALKAELSKLK